MEVINTISAIITAIATIALAAFAFQARDSFLKQELYNFGWNFLQEYQNYREWLLHNKKFLDEELNTEETDIALDNYNRFSNVEKSFLRLEIMTNEKFFRKTKEQMRKVHQLNIQYYAKDKNDEANEIRKNIGMELIQNNVAISDFIEFVDSEVKTIKQKKIRMK